MHGPQHKKTGKKIGGTKRQKTMQKQGLVKKLF